jgi:transcription antitermination factor NusG
MQNLLIGQSVQDGRGESDWYAVYTRHQHEKTAADLLAKKGFETFLPLYSATHRWKDRNKVVSLPLYPNYIFLHGGVERRIAILSTPGTIGLVEFAGRASRIPAAEIEAIRRVIENKLSVEPHPFLKCGDWVRVKSGPLEGIEGILTRKKNQDRLVLSVDLLQKSVSVEVDALAVERTGRVAAPAIDPRVRGPVFERCYS